MSKKNQGFSIVKILPMVLVVVIVGLGGWFIGRSSGSKSGSKTATVQKSVYADAVGKYSFSYPSNWKVETKTDKLEGTDDPTSVVTVTSPDSTTLKIDTNYGGRGGDCEPADTELPHEPTNTCPTIEYLSKEETGGKVKNVDKSFPLQLVTARYTANTTSKYIIGLHNEDTYPITISEPIIGAVSGFTSFSSDEFSYDIYAGGDSADFFGSTDGVAIKEILKSFRLND